MPSGIATDDSTKHFFQDIVQSNALAQLVSFENSERIFSDVKTTYRFCLLTTNRTGDPTTQVRFAFFLTNTNQITDPGRSFTLTNADIARLNPNTNTCPIFRSKTDALISAEIHKRLPVIWDETKPDGNIWNIRFQRVFDMTNDSDHFVESTSGTVVESPDDYFPMWEDWMIHHFDHRYQSHGGEPVTLSQHADSHYRPTPRYCVSRDEVFSRTDSARYFFGFRNRTNVADSRAVIGTLIPRSAVGNTVPVIHFESAHDAAAFCAMLSSYCLDYFSRQKIGGMNLNYFILKQLPCIDQDRLADWTSFVIQHVLELTYTAWDLEAFALDCGYAGPPFRWDEERRFLLRCELDAAYFHLYLGPPVEWGTDSPQLREMFPTPRDVASYIMETFPIVKRKDIARTAGKDARGEVATEGTYITKDTILAIYDEMQQAIDTGEPYQTRLDPPPGPPTDANGDFIPMDQWDKADWPAHVHQPGAVTQDA